MVTASCGVSGATAMTAAVFRYQYAGKTSGPRYEAWREGFGRKWISADFEPIRDDYIASEIMGSQLSFVTLGCVRGMPLHTDRRNDIGQTGQGQLFLVLASGCSIRASQRGKSIDLARGDLTLMSGNEPARLTQFTEGSRWSVRIPHRLVADMCRGVEDKITRPIAKSELGISSCTKLRLRTGSGPSSIPLPTT